MAISQEELNRIYRRYLDRDLSEGEYERHWANSKLDIKGVQDIVMRSPEAQELNTYKDRYSEIGKEFGDRAGVEEAVRGYYQQYLGREDEEGVKAWTDDIMAGKYDIDTLARRFRASAFDENFAEGIKSMKEPVDFGLDETAIQREYEEAGVKLQEQQRSMAAGGGLDTGGYMTSVAKGRAQLETGRINTLADLNRNIAQFHLQRDTQIANLILAKENQEISQEQFNTEMSAYNEEIAAVRDAVRKNQENWWQPVLAGIAGTALAYAIPGVGAAVAPAVGAGVAAGVGGQAPTMTRQMPQMPKSSMLSPQYNPVYGAAPYGGAYGYGLQPNTGYSPYKG